MEEVLLLFDVVWGALPLGMPCLFWLLLLFACWGCGCPELLFTARISTSFRRIFEVIRFFPSRSVTRRISTLSPGLANPETPVTSFTEKDTARMPSGMSPTKPPARWDSLRPVMISPM